MNITTFNSFKSRNYRLFFAGQSVSLIGTWIQKTAALNSSMVILSKLIGSALAGFILESYGEQVCFGLNALSFIAVIVSLLNIPN